MRVKYTSTAKCHSDWNFIPWHNIVDATIYCLRGNVLQAWTSTIQFNWYVHLYCADRSLNPVIFSSIRTKGRTLAHLRVQEPPLDGLDPFSYTLKLTNMSHQNFKDPLNFTRHGMSKTFAGLLTPTIVIFNTKENWKLTHYDTENQEIFFRWAIFRTSDPLNSHWTPYI